MIVAIPCLPIAVLTAETITASLFITISPLGFEYYYFSGKVLIFSVGKTHL
jgi:hypothetical protein